MVPPNATVRVYGGRKLDRIDADEVRNTAQRVSGLAGHLTAAMEACRLAAAQLELAAQRLNSEAAALVAGISAMLAQFDQADWSRRRNTASDLQTQAISANRIAANLQSTSQLLASLAEDALSHQDALLKAAGLYEEHESWATQLVSSGIISITAQQVFWATKFPLLTAARALLFGASLAAGGYLAHRFTNGASTKALPPFLVRRLAGVSDELVAGLSLGIAAGYPKLAGSLSTTGGVAVLSTFARIAVRPAPLQVVEVIPGTPAFNGSALVMGEQPAVLRYQGIPSGDILTALTRVGDLHPFDPVATTDNERVAATENLRVAQDQAEYRFNVPNARSPITPTEQTEHTAPTANKTGYPVQGRGGLPTGTIGVERVEHLDGTVSWTVLIPGTQKFAPGDHAFDGLTDLDLMAHRYAQVNQQVIAALQQVGAKQDEPVVLIGHSLGGIAAMSLAGSVIFTSQFQVGGVITAGSPTATFTPPPGVPVLHLENDEEVVSNLDGQSGNGNPRTEDRVTITRRLAASDDPRDQQAAHGLEGAHPIETHQRTLALALETGNQQVQVVTERLNELLNGEQAQTRYFTGRRVP